MRPAKSNSGGGGAPFDPTMDLNPTLYSQFALGFHFMPDAVKGFFVIAKICLEYFLTQYSLPLEVYLRWRWGSRAMGAFQLGSLWVLAVLSFPVGGLLSLFLWGAAGLGVWHFLEARRWETRNPGPQFWRLTFSFGEPVVWFALVNRFARRNRLSRWIGTFTIFRVLEPGTGIALGLLLSRLPFTRFLGYALLVSGVALLIKRHLLYMRHVDETRDRRDAVAIGEMLGAEADATQRRTDFSEAFEVRLAVPVLLPVIALPFVPVQVPTPLPEAPVAALPPAAGRVLRGPDAGGKVAAECPFCLRSIRCAATRGESGVTCPNCKESFVFTRPIEAAS